MIVAMMELVFVSTSYLFLIGYHFHLTYVAYELRQFRAISTVFIGYQALSYFSSPSLKTCAD